MCSGEYVTKNIIRAFGTPFCTSVMLKWAFLYAYLESDDKASVTEGLGRLAKTLCYRES